MEKAELQVLIRQFSNLMTDIGRQLLELKTSEIDTNNLLELAALQLLTRQLIRGFTTMQNFIHNPLKAIPGH